MLQMDQDAEAFRKAFLGRHVGRRLTRRPDDLPVGVEERILVPRLVDQAIELLPGRLRPSVGRDGCEGGKASQ